MLVNLEDLRENYDALTLVEADALADPILQFQNWMEAAIAAKLPEPNAMILATAQTNGQPSARVVLLKGLQPEGFIFYSNYESAKAQQMEANAKVALVFNWLELHRQVRVEGTVAKLSAEQSTAYFQSRPKGSQIGAWASPQSQVILDRSILEDNVVALKAKYEQQEQLPRPENWGGYIIKPQLIEFWQGRPSRLHDRLRYTKPTNETETNWQIDRLAP
ncbi:MAG: pyridoxamine 5'-phosphate oxidase [Bacteroidota bacterium]